MTIKMSLIGQDAYWYEAWGIPKGEKGLCYFSGEGDNLEFIDSK